MKASALMLQANVRSVVSPMAVDVFSDRKHFSANAAATATNTTKPCGVR
jgi:hypothetical protein